MVSKVTLSLSDKASENLIKWSKTLGLTQNEFASLCFETVNIKHQGIVLAAKKIKEEKKSRNIRKQDLSQHLQQLSAKQIEVLLQKAANKRKN